MNSPKYWDNWFKEKKNYFTRSIQVEVMKNIKNRGLKILELGCGNGTLACALQHEVEAKVIGIDYSEVALQYARNLGIKVIQGDIRELEKLVNNTYDMIISSNVLEHISLQEMPVFSKISENQIHIISIAEKDVHSTIMNLKEWENYLSGEGYYFRVSEWKEKQILIRTFSKNWEVYRTYDL